MSIAPCQLAGELFGVGVDEKLVGVEPESAFRLIGPMHAIAVTLSGDDVAEITMPHVLRFFRKWHAIEFPPTMRVEETEFDLARIGREKREISAMPCPGGAKRVWLTGADPHVTSPERSKWRQVAEQQG
jgi:hypothetical protein